jgi:hypothetical protein
MWPQSCIGKSNHYFGSFAMTEFDVFSDATAMQVYAIGVLVLIALQIEIANFIVKRLPQKLPASVVRRAL